MKCYLLFLVFLGSFMSAFSVPVDSLFMRAPNDVLPLLSREAREDLLRSDVRGRKGLDTRGTDTPCVISRTDDCLLVRLSPRVDMAFVALLVDGRPMCATLQTLYLPAADTEVRLWDADWNEAAVRLPHLEFEDFLVSTDSLSVFGKNELRAMLRPHHVAWEWHQETSEFFATLSLEALPDFERLRWQNYLRPRSFSPSELFKSLPEGIKTP